MLLTCPLKFCFVIGLVFLLGKYLLPQHLKQELGAQDHLLLLKGEPLEAENDLERVELEELVGHYVQRSGEVTPSSTQKLNESSGGEFGHLQHYHQKEKSLAKIT